MKKKITQLTNADIHKIDLVPEGAQQLSRIEILKNKEGIVMQENTCKFSDSDIKEIEDMLETLKEKLGIKEETEDKVEDKVEETTEEVEETTEKAEDTPAEDKKEETEDKSEEVKDALAKAADAIEKANQLKEEIAKMKDEKITKEFISKASEMKNIPGVNEEELGKILKSVYMTNKETYEQLEMILKSANEAISSGSLFVEKGTNTTVVEPQTSDEAYKMIEAMASNRVEKGLSDKANCISDVLKSKEGEILYRQYKALREGGR